MCTSIPSKFVHRLIYEALTYYRLMCTCISYRIFWRKTKLIYIQHCFTLRVLLYCIYICICITCVRINNSGNCFLKIGHSRGKKVSHYAWLSTRGCLPRTERLLWNRTNWKALCRPTRTSISSSLIRDKYVGSSCVSTCNKYIMSCLTGLQWLTF